MIIVLLLYFLMVPVVAFKDPCPLEYQDRVSQYYINELQLCKESDDGSPACIQNREESQRYICQLAVQGYCYECDPQLCSTFGIVCKGSTPPPPPPEGDSTWVIVVGTLGVLGAGAIAGAKILGGKKTAPATDDKGSEKEKKKKEPVTYILQLSANHLSVSSEEPASLSVTVWKKTGDKPPAPASDAVVTISNPPGSGLSVTPFTGNSPLRAEIAQTGDAKKPSVVLGITASAGGTTKKAEVTVDVSGRTKIEFD